MSYRRVHLLILGTLACCLALSCGGVKSTPRTADETVTWVAQDLVNERPEVLWEALPPSYQADVTSVVHEFANAVDPEVYGKAFDVVGKTVDVLKTKKDVILGSSMFSMAQVDPDRVAQNWDSVVGLFDAIVSSDLSDLEKVKTMDPGAFMSTTGAAVMKQAAGASRISEDDPYANEFRANLEAMQVETIATEGDTATIRVTVPDEDPEEIQLVRVEERWVPKDLADNWDREIAEARERIAYLSGEEFQQNKMQVMMGPGSATTCAKSAGRSLRGTLRRHRREVRVRA